MSFTELKEQVAALSAKERLQLAAFLADMEEEGEADFQEKVDKRMRAMDAGRKVTAEQVEKQHKKLQAKGL
jgi:hypothetical protein